MFNTQETMMEQLKQIALAYRKSAQANNLKSVSLNWESIDGHDRPVVNIEFYPPKPEPLEVQATASDVRHDSVLVKWDHVIKPGFFLIRTK